MHDIDEFFKNENSIKLEEKTLSESNLYQFQRLPKKKEFTTTSLMERIQSIVERFNTYNRFIINSLTIMTSHGTFSHGKYRIFLIFF